MTVPPFTPMPVLQGEPSPGRDSVPTPALVGGLFSRRQIRSITDGLTNVIIKTGGISIILCILGMCIFLVKEVVPLFQPSYATPAEPITLSPLDRPSASALIGVDEHQELAYVLRGDALEFVFLGDAGSAAHSPSRSLLPGGSVTASARAFGKGHSLAVGTEDGRVIPVAIEFTQDFQGNERSIAPSVTVGIPMVAAPTPQPITKMAYQSADSDVRIATLLQDQHLWLTTSRTASRPDGTAEASISQVDLTPHISGRVTAITLASRAELLAVGTEEGKVYHFDLREPEKPGLVEISQVSEGSDAITALAYLMGDRSLVVGGASGQIAVWMPVREHAATNATHMTRIHRFAPHQRAVTDITISQRDKGFITTDAGGEIRLHHSTSEQTLLTLAPQQGALRSTYFSPKADGLVGLAENNRLVHYHISNPYPEITLATLFSPVMYEGYDRPELVWQSSSGSDDFEAKFSLTPLIFGTIKGTFYAVLLAVPLAVLAAIYTAMFMHPNLRAKIKPTIEIMAALPTVVLGFLAGLWFAPVLERNFPAMTGMVLMMPLVIALSSGLFLLLPASLKHRVRPGAEALLMVPIIIAVVWGCLETSAWWESFLFDGHFKPWIQTHLGLNYDQRNAIVVGVAMGFAIIPIIYSISEEALSNVPKNLIAGSLALGATRWQTLTHLVLISASPGIFSALMIGFGRAVGETMIVLMATGNTPIMDWSLFNGFRTLSANIAVEIPEAPHGGTLYRTLFLAGLLLFIATFLLNTVAELVRQRLREKYSQF
ncbi:ABC transporter permease subunit [Candidatus Nitrospira nitrificans]|nr:ABC transporter permease subunit [Candidatus Nitrospira nitrificans]